MGDSSFRNRMISSDYIRLPLPDYVVSWGHHVHRPKSLPENTYDDHIDPAHIFAFPYNPETGAEGEFYIVAKKCNRCAKLRRPCTRGDPMCRACEEAGSECVTAPGWIELPPKVVARPPETLSKEIRMLRRASLPENLRPVFPSADEQGSGPQSSHNRAGESLSAGPAPRATYNFRTRSGHSPEHSTRRSPKKPVPRLAINQLVAHAAKQFSSNIGRRGSQLFHTKRSRQPPPPTQETLKGGVVAPDALLVAPTPPPPASPSRSSPTKKQSFRLSLPRPKNTNPYATRANAARLSSAFAPGAVNPSSPTQNTSSAPPPPSSMTTRSGVQLLRAEVFTTRLVDRVSRSSPSKRTQQPKPTTPPAPPSNTPATVPLASRATSASSALTPISTASRSQSPHDELPVSSPSNTTVPPTSPVATWHRETAEDQEESPLHSMPIREVETHSRRDEQGNSQQSIPVDRKLPTAQPDIPLSYTDGIFTEAVLGKDVMLEDRDKEFSLPEQTTEDDMPTIKTSIVDAPARGVLTEGVPREQTPAENIPVEDVSTAGAPTSELDDPVAGPSHTPTSTRFGDTSPESASSFRLSATYTWTRVSSPECDSESSSDSDFIWGGLTKGKGKARAAHVGDSANKNVGDLPLKRKRTGRSRDNLPLTNGHSDVYGNGTDQPVPTYQAELVQDNEEEFDIDSEEEVARYLKRPRTRRSQPTSPPNSSSQGPTPVTLIARRPLSDDSALIQVENTIFHLSRTQLADASAYFTKILGRDSGQIKFTPDRAAHSVDRYQVTKVYGVSAKDFETALNALAEIEQFRVSITHFQVLVAVFCVSRTFEFGELDFVATNKLCAMWSDELSNLSHRVPFAAETVILVRRYGIPLFSSSVLKRAFYELLRTEGFGQYHLTRLDEIDGNQLNGSDLVGKARLSHADLVRLTLTREKLQHVWTQIATSDPGITMSACPLRYPYAAQLGSPLRERCMEATIDSARIWTDYVMASGVFSAWMNDPIGGLEKLAGLDWAAAGYCPACSTARKRYWLKRREDLWNNLSAWLGL